MNLSPEWVGALARHAWEALHWSQIGDIRGPDDMIMDWARQNGHIVFTHDLDFGAILAATQANAPG